MIVGADGMRSAPRRQWYPGEGEPVWKRAVDLFQDWRFPGWACRLCQPRPARSWNTPWSTAGHTATPRCSAMPHTLTPDELTEIATGYKKAAGFHPDALDNRPSLTPPGRGLDGADRE
ncbi:hypothetical protein GCM10009531_61630 [Actinoplanes capillaceus]